MKNLWLLACTVSFLALALSLFVNFRVEGLRQAVTRLSQENQVRTQEESVAAVGADPSLRRFKKYAGNPVLSQGPEGSWDHRWAAEASVFRDLKPDNNEHETRTYLYYYGRDDSGIHRIGYAWSDDGGHTFVKSPSNPVLSPSETWEGGATGKIDGPFVRLNGARDFQMWYNGRTKPEPASVFQIGYASSTNGQDWVKYSQNPVLKHGESGQWDERGVLNPSVLKTGAVYRMWYTGYDAGWNGRIGLATATNPGGPWSKYVGNPVLDLGDSGDFDGYGVASPQVVRWGDLYLMIYQGMTAPTYRREWNIGLAFSANGRSWHRKSFGPILTIGQAGEWDSSQIAAPRLLKAKNRLLLYYTGSDVRDDNWRIGLATTTISP